MNTITCTADAVGWWRQHNSDLDPAVEHWCALAVDKDGTIVAQMQGSGTRTTVIRPLRPILQAALVNGAVGVITMHTHPSPHTTDPSVADMHQALGMRRACGILELVHLDDVIIGHGGDFFSFHGAGWLAAADAVRAAAHEEQWTAGMRTVLDFIGQSDPKLVGNAVLAADLAGVAPEEYALDKLMGALTTTFRP